MQTAIEQFHAYALQEAGLCRVLWAASDREQLLEQVCAWAAARGVVLTRAELLAAMFTPRREWRERGPITTQPTDLTDWMPIRLAFRQGQPLVEWCYCGTRRFTDPFFEYTVAACLRHPFNALVRLQTPVERLLECAAHQPGLPPHGFIFHMSRCGSTLAAQSLAALPQAQVLAEAEPIDAVLRADVSDEQRSLWLQAVVSALGRPRLGEQQLYIKFDSWHIFDLPLILRTFPDVPWLFLYRDPLEVMVSHQRMRGSQMIPGVIEPARFGLRPEDLPGMPLDTYCARVLAAICAAARDAHGCGVSRFIAYPQLPAFLENDLLALFGLERSHAASEQVRRVAQFDAKRPNQRFVGDTSAKQHAASSELRELARHWVEPIYQQLLACTASETAA